MYFAFCSQKAIHLRQLEDIAVQSDNRRLLSNTLASWRNRQSRIQTLAQQADSLSSDFSTRLLRTSVKTWSLSTTAAKFYHARSQAFAKNSLSTWIERLDHLQIELEGRALNVLQEKNKQLRSVTFDAWRSSIQHRNRLELAADAVSRKYTLTRSLATWRKRREGVELDGRKADVVRQFFAQRGAWRIWVDKVQEKKQRKWLEARIRLRKKEALDCKPILAKYRGDVGARRHFVIQSGRSERSVQERTRNWSHSSSKRIERYVHHSDSRSFYDSLGAIQSSALSKNVLRSGRNK